LVGVLRRNPFDVRVPDFAKSAEFIWLIWCSL
jgi:hypothetical protein